MVLLMQVTISREDGRCPGEHGSTESTNEDRNHSRNGLERKRNEGEIQLEALYKSKAPALGTQQTPVSSLFGGRSRRSADGVCVSGLYWEQPGPHTRFVVETIWAQVAIPAQITLVVGLGGIQWYGGIMQMTRSDIWSMWLRRRRGSKVVAAGRSCRHRQRRFRWFGGCCVINLDLDNAMSSAILSLRKRSTSFSSPAGPYLFRTCPWEHAGIVELISIQGFGQFSNARRAIRDRRRIRAVPALWISGLMSIAIVIVLQPGENDLKSSVCPEM